MKRRHPAPIAAPRPDRSTVFVVNKKAAPRVVREVAGGACGGSGSSWAGEVVCGGPVAQVAVSTTNAGYTFLGALLESGVLEIWDVAAPQGGLYTLREVVHLPGAASGDSSSSGSGSKNAGAPLDCLFSGSRGLPSALFFFVSGGAGGQPGGSSETSRLHVVKFHPSIGPPTLGTQRLAAPDASRKKAAVVALTCHESRPLLCVGFQDGVLHLYDVSGVAAENDGGAGGDKTVSAAARGYGTDGGDKQGGNEDVEGEDGNDSDDGQEQESGTATTGGKSTRSLFLGKSARNLLLSPVAAFKFAAQMQGALSSVCLSSESGLILAGSMRGEMAVWSTNSLLREAAQGGTSGGDNALNLSGAVLPLQSCVVVSTPSPIERVGFFDGTSPLVFASVREANGNIGVTRAALLALLPKSLAVVHMGPPVRGRHMAFQSRDSSLVLLEEGDNVDKLRVSGLADVLACSALSLPSHLAAMGPPHLDCGAFLGGSWGDLQPSSSSSSPPSVPSPVIYSVQSRMTLSVYQSGTSSLSVSRKGGVPSVRGSLAFKALIVAQPLHHFQNKGASDGDNDNQTAAALLLPTYGKEFSALLDSLGLSPSVPLLPGLSKDDYQTLLLPHRLLVSPDGATIVVLLRILRPQVAGSEITDDACAPLAYVIARQSSSAQGEGVVEANGNGQDASLSFDFVHAGMAVDVAFLSPRALALLQSFTGKCGTVTRTTLLQANGNPTAPTTVWATAQPVKDEEVQGEEGMQDYFTTRLFGAGRNDASGELEGLHRVVYALQQRQAGEKGRTVLACSRAGGGLAPSMIGPSVLVLREQEVVFEVVGQTSNGQGIDVGSVVAVLTSQRLLLLSPELALLGAAETTQAPCGLAWLGPTPLVLFADGRVLYLCVGPCGQGAAAELRPVLSLDQKQAGADVTLVAALPDRLVYAAKNGASGSLRISTRPLLPLEPLLVGFLAWPRLVKLPVLPSFSTPSALYSPSQSPPAPPSTAEAATTSPLFAAALKAVLDRYGPLEKQTGTRFGPGEGPSVDAGATAWVCATLSRAGFSQWAAALAGVAGPAQLREGQGSQAGLLAGMSGSEAFQPRPWIPPEVKAGLAAQNSHWQQALFEAMGDDMAGQDYALHPDATLPPRFRRHSRVLALLGQRAWQGGQAEEALRLFDVASEDENAMELLMLHILGGGPVSQGCAQLLRDLCDAKAEPHLVACLGEATMAKDTGGAKKRDDVANVVGARLSSQAFPFDSQRRQSLLPRLAGAVQQLTQWPEAGIASSTIAPCVSPLPPSSSSSALGRDGPPRAPLVQRLLLDRVEEWLGRMAPEGLREELAESGEQEGDAAKGYEEWVKGVGEGREEEDKVVLYWRFNEPVPPADSSVTPEASLRLAGDLSQYGHSLDLMVGQPESLTFVKSTCPIDQGDDGKVRMGMDALWSSSDVSQVSPSLPRGLRTIVTRGSALDVGPYHGPQQQPGRCRLTAELWIQRPSSSSSSSSPPEVLMARKTLDEKPLCLWALGVSAEGALVFWTEGKETPLSTAPGTVAEGKWAHIAFTLETKGLGGKQASVALFVGGKEASPTPSLIKFPALSESQLRRTVFEVGPNLHGHRMTELRLWACARSAEDLYDNRESYLQLAERRKKLAFKIKTEGGRGTRNEDSEAREAAAPTPPPPLPMTAARPPGMFAPLPMVPPPAITTSAPALLSQPAGGTLPMRRRAAGREGTPSPTVLGGLNGLGGEGAGSLLASLPALSASGAAARRRRGSPSSMDGAATASPPPPSRPSVEINTGWAGFGEETAPTPTPVPAATAATSTPEPAPPSPESVSTSAPPKLEHQLLLLPTELDVHPANVLRDEAAVYFSLGGQYLCLREKSMSPNGDGALVVKVAIVVLTMSTSAEQPARRDRYPFQAESAILVGGLPSPLSSSSSSALSVPSPIIACYTLAGTASSTIGGITQPQAGVLQVYDLTQRKGVARQPVQTRVLFWRWLSRGVVALVTPRAVFTWVVGVEGGPSGVPTKTFDRRDLTHLGPSAKVRDYHLAADGEWGILTTIDGDGAQLAIQFHHVGSGNVIVESGTDLLSANVGRCDGGFDQGSGGSQMYFVLFRRSPELCVDLCVEEGGESEQGMGNSSLTRLARLPLPSAPAFLSDTGRAWVLFPPGRTDVIVLLFSAGGLLYTCHPATQQVQARGSVFPDEQAGTVLDVSWDAVSEDMLVLEAERLAVFRVSNL